MLGWKPRAAPAPAIDAAFLARLEAHLGAPVLTELLEDGQLELADRLDRLEAMAEAGAGTGILRLGHDLAGLAGHLGLSALARAAAEMARSGRADPPPDPAALAAPVLAAGRAAEAALRELLAGPRGG